MSEVMKFGIGQPVRRREDGRFLRGAGRYVDDITLDRQAHACFLRSPHAHALISAIDIAEASAALGVLAVFTHSDATALGMNDLESQAPVANADGTPIAPAKLPPLARDRVRFVGQPVAMVVAESAAAARDALDLIQVDYQDLPAVTAPRAALAEGAPLLHEVAPGNRAYFWRVGDAQAARAAFDAAAHRVSARVVNQRVIVNPMEPRAANADYDPDTGRWTLYCGSQGTHMLRGMVARNLGVKSSRLRVITPDVGGGFGMKLMLHPEYALVCAASQRLERPVKWTSDRSEAFVSDAQGRGLETDAEAAFDADGRLLALRMRSLSNIGAYYSQFGAGIHTEFSAVLAGAFYRAPVVDVEVTGVFTNTTSMDAYRGAGRPEMSFVVEQLMEKAGRATGLGAVEIRRRNLLTAADMPHRMPGGPVIDSGDGVVSLDKVLAASDHAGAEARRQAARAAGKVLGVGVAYYMERTGGGPSENARLRVRADGRIEAWVGTQSNGQGHETAWSQLIHEKLGVDPELIDFPPGDSDALPLGGGTGGSRSLIMAHRVFFLAADDVVAKGRDVAARLLEAASADIEYSRAEGGRFRVAGTDRAIDLFAVAAEMEDGEGGHAIIGDGRVDDREPTFPNGAHVVEAEIEPRTGLVRLTRYTVADDMGFVMNPMLVEGQIQGGVAQGVGQALFEEARWDPESGQPLTGSFMDYQMPRAADIPPMSVILSDHAPTPTNPLGVKGCGEAGSVGAISAATMAVLDALGQLGVEELQPPYTPLRVWQAIQAARGN